MPRDMHGDQLDSPLTEIVRMKFDALREMLFGKAPCEDYYPWRQRLSDWKKLSPDPYRPVPKESPTKIPTQLFDNAFKRHTPILGFDISRHQGKVNHSALQRFGFCFGFVKCTEGGSSQGKGYVDPLFAQNWTAMGKAGTIRGIYHFARVSKKASNGLFGFGVDGENEASWMLSHYPEKPQPGVLPPVLDVEWDRKAREAGVRPADVEEFCYAFVETVKQRIGIPPIIYTGPNFWRYRMNRTTALMDCPLWIVSGYTGSLTEPRREIPGWGWLFHQYTNKFPFGSKNIDANYFRGTMADLRALANIPEDSVRGTL